MPTPQGGVKHVYQCHGQLAFDGGALWAHGNLPELTS